MKDFSVSVNAETELRRGQTIDSAATDSLPVSERHNKPVVTLSLTFPIDPRWSLGNVKFKNPTSLKHA